MSRFQNRLGHRCYGYDRQGERYTGYQRHHSDVRPHGTDYGYARPRRMLVAVKEGMLHPKPPTYRRLDMDETLRKLPIEHCRTSTSRSVDDFRHASITLFNKTKLPLPEEISLAEDGENEDSSMTERARAATAAGLFMPAVTTRQKSFTPSYGEVLRRNREKLGERFPAFGKEPDESSFSRRYQFQYIPPRVSPEQYTKVHFVDWTGIRPMPANTYSRYRDAHPKYSENISSKAWRF